MILQEVYSCYRNYQMILSLSNNEDVLITEDCFNPDSKFYRSSKVRLSIEFEISGYINGDNLIHINQMSSNDSDVIIFRTYRGDAKNDYLLYLYKDYQVLSSTRKKVSRRRVMKQTEHQITLNERTKPIPDKTLIITPHMDGNDYYVSYKHDGFKQGTFNSAYHPNPFQQHYAYAYLGYYAAVLFGLNIAKRYPERITEVRIDVTQDDYVKGIGYISSGKWKPRNEYTRAYFNHFEVLRKELQNLGMSIRFIYEEEDKI